MSEYVIEKAIPIPASGKAATKSILLKQLEIGDSFYLEGVSYNASAIYSFRAIAHRLNLKLCVRKVEGGVRIWRVA